MRCDARSSARSLHFANQPWSHVSGGGGERDRHHGHDPVKSKRDTEENAIQKAKG